MAVQRDLLYMCLYVSYFRVIDMQERNCLIQNHETVAEPKILCCVVSLHISVNIMTLNIHCCFVDDKIEAFAFSAVQVMRRLHDKTACTSNSYLSSRKWTGNRLLYSSFHVLDLPYPSVACPFINIHLLLYL